MNEEQKSEILNDFPKLTFYIFDFNYNFELTKDDVFTEVNNILYFMIIYQRELFNNPELVYWDLGLPLLIKYQFVHNYKKKMIGFYLPETEDDKEEEITDGNKNKKEEDNKNTEEPIITKDDTNNNTVAYIIIGIVAGILLLIAAFCLGKYMFQGRKKKANELEENFEYVSKDQNKEKEDDKIIN